MMYFCNPINVPYRYQFNADQRKNKISICREAADPSLICFKDKYYIFASMTLGYWVSDDLVSWKAKRLPDTLPLYDYAPDVRVIGEWVYFCASKRGEVCHRYRTKDIENGPYECIEGSFDYWDPNLFVDDDGRVYFYWGCSNETPIWGVELDPVSMEMIGERKALISGHPEKHGYERIGDNNTLLPKNEEEIEAAFDAYLKNMNMPIDQIPKQYLPLIRGMLSNKPYIEGAWMDKHDGMYYLQYAFAGTQYNTYGDGVYVSESPLGPFRLAKNNPYSFKPGGFIQGAGHGSTLIEDENVYHVSTMRISKNHDFERRVGLWLAGFDEDGELYTNQRYGDWPIALDVSKKNNPWADPEWMLLSYGKKASASSCQEHHPASYAVNENIQNWWRPSTVSKNEWLMVDLGQSHEVFAIQVNFADDEIVIPVPGKIRGTTQARYIEEANLHTRYLLEGSKDGTSFFTIVDKTKADTDLSHDLIVLEDGLDIRYLRLSKMEVPYNQIPCISGIRVFGKGNGECPLKASYTFKKTSDIDLKVSIVKQDNTIGYSVLWGHDKAKLYHSIMTFDQEVNIGALVKGESYYLRVDSFNESGITKGEILFVG